eukprot:157913_1
MAYKPNHSRIVIASYLKDTVGNNLIDESIRVLGRIKEIDLLNNCGIIILDDNETLLKIDISLLKKDNYKQLNVGNLYHFIGEYRYANKKKQLVVRISHKLPIDFNVKRYLQCLNCMLNNINV